MISTTFDKEINIITFKVWNKSLNNEKFEVQNFAAQAKRLAAAKELIL